jgi:hypothetical protein
MLLRTSAWLVCRVLEAPLIKVTRVVSLPPPALLAITGQAALRAQRDRLLVLECPVSAMDIDALLTELTQEPQ